MKPLLFSINIFILFVLIHLLACLDNKYPDYSIAENGLQYKILAESESKTKLSTGDIVELKLKYSTTSDSVLFNSDELGTPFRMQVQKTSHQGGSFEDALLMLKPGGRSQYIISADSFFIKTMRQKLPGQIEKGSNLIFDISIIKIMDKEEVEAEREQLAEKNKLQESDLLNQYLLDNKIAVKPFKSGLIYIELKKGSGRLVKAGDILEVNYKGMLVDSKVFDSSFDRNDTFSFQLGNGKVIAGWEEGFLQMRKGGKAKFIIPSNLAYGKEGYGSLIPPYSSLIFEVEIVDINY